MRTPARRLCAVQEGSVRFGGPGKCTGAFGFRVRVEPQGLRGFSEILALLRDSPRTPLRNLMRTPSRRLCAVPAGSVRFGGPGKCTGAFGLGAAEDCVNFRGFSPPRNPQRTS